MSYCRFSSDNWRSDVYVYNSSGYPEGADITIYVAANRHISHPDHPFPPIRDGNFTVDQLFADNKASSEAIDHGTTETIDHPDAGAEHYGLTPGEAYDELTRLQANGFHVPQHALDALAAEVIGQ